MSAVISPEMKARELVVRTDSGREAPPSATTRFVNRVESHTRHMRTDVWEPRPDVTVGPNSTIGGIRYINPGGGEQRRPDPAELLNGSRDGIRGEKNVRVEVQAREG
jgi:hypothetical protein